MPAAILPENQTLGRPMLVKEQSCGSGSGNGGKGKEKEKGKGEEAGSGRAFCSGDGMPLSNVQNV